MERELDTERIGYSMVYNRSLANRPGAVRLEPAPPPRRFAQGMAGSFALAIGMLLLLQGEGSEGITPLPLVP